MLVKDVENLATTATSMKESAAKVYAVVKHMRKITPKCIKLQYNMEDKENLFRYVNRCIDFIGELQKEIFDKTIIEIHKMEMEMEAQVICDKIAEIKIPGANPTNDSDASTSGDNEDETVDVD
ncbi:uncharacterized protein LOC112460827 [Temnothorax curvispinosus]|uniref:Uncharacterized protein LOC112459998 n=1 Tax=Temnothorax curvispinosus TaxID=300111 RepID=A0A6J1QCY4_9HYME|nr:uncharacterized protein LOC112459998 [Temnothorax curvispinosus]XP_024881483.1 uncharacterized protein LOC112460827 [Temnothorax curvispinosus]